MISRKLSVYCITILFCISTIAQSATEAQQLVTKLPDNTLGFIASSGTDSLKTNFDKTYLGQIWNDPSFQTFYLAIKNELLRKIKEESKDPNHTQAINTVKDIAELVTSRPFILAIAPKDDPEIPIYGSLIIDTRQKKEKFAQMLSEIESYAKDDYSDVNIAGMKMRGFKGGDVNGFYYGFIKNNLIFAFNDQQGLALNNIQKSNPQTSQLLGKVPATDDALFIHLDFQKIAQLIKSIASDQSDEEEIEIIRNVINRLGLANVQTFTARVGFKDTGVVIDALLEVPEPRTGLLAVQKPVDLEALKIVNEGTVMACTCHLDLAAAYDLILDAVKIASPNEAYPMFNETIAQFEAQSNCSIRNGLLAGLEGPMTLYNLPPGSLIQTPTSAVVAVVSLSDPNLFAANLTALGEFLAAKSKGTQTGIQIRSQQLDGRNVQMWVVPALAYMQIIPCWTVVDNRLIVCSNPALIEPVAKKITDPNPAGSLYVSDGFKKIMPTLPPKITCLKYVNSELQFNQTMMTVQQFWPMVTIAAAHEGINLPVILPQLGHISQKMHPAYGYNFSDSTGLRYHYHGLGIEQSLMSVAGVSLAMAILMPALAQVRRMAQRIQSATNLSAIGKACLIYANDHDEKLPPDLETLAAYADLPPKILTSPRKSASFEGPDYIYIHGQDAAMNPQNVLTYENPEYCTDGVNVLYLDCRVEFVKPDRFREELRQTYNRLNRPVPDMKFRFDTGPESDGLPDVQPPDTHHDSDALHKAVFLNNLPQIRSLINDRIDLNSKDENGRTPLHLAAQSGFDEAAKILIEAGADIDAKDTKFRTPLYLAIDSGNEPLSYYLMEKGADVNARGGMYTTPLHLAARFGRTNIAEKLIACGADVNSRHQGNWTPLLLTARFGYPQTAELLLKNGADLHAVTVLQMSPLMFSVLHRHPEVEKVLLKHGAQKDIFTETMRNNVPSVKSLIKKNPGLVNSLRGEFTPLHWACYLGYLEIAELLIENGAEIEPNAEYAPPLYWAVLYNRQNIVRMLLEKGVDINKMNKDGISVFFAAGSPQMAKLLIDNGADVAIRLKERNATLIHYFASKKGYYIALKSVMDFNEEVSEKQPEHIKRGAMENQAEIIKLLIQNGIDPAAKDSEGYTPIMYARSYNNTPVIEVLREYE